MSDMDIVEVDEENQFHSIKNEIHTLNSQPGNLIPTKIYYCYYIIIFYGSHNL